MNVLHAIAETRIREAIARGDFDDLPGKGKPLQLEDLSRVPDDLRASYLVCKNAGVLPEEMQLRKDVLDIHDLVRACTDDGERTELRGRLAAATLRLELLMEKHRGSSAWTQYRGALHRRLGGY